ncbi:MAG: biotin/lipoyl-binding protein [Vampirovibrionales bacterium]|nr:biotin/lipoyl-binding protein [Vampirovibrionales bacterium]
MFLANATQQFAQSRALRLMRAPGLLSRWALWSLLLLLLAILALTFVPWQQTVVGSGQVTVFSPGARPQTLEATINGRIKRWHVIEGAQVKQGDLLVELADLDPKFLNPQQQALLLSQKEALLAKKSATEQRISALQAQLASVGASRASQLPGAQLKIAQSAQKQNAATQTVIAAEQNRLTASLNLERTRTLYGQGLKSKRDLELAELTAAQANTAYQQSLASKSVAQQDIGIARAEQGKVTGDTAASLASVSGSLASAQESLATVNSDLAKLAVDIENLNLRAEQRALKAPASGRIVRLMQAGVGETVMEGDVLATIVPDTPDPMAEQAVALYITDWDAPLVHIGAPVRLQFDGWPAIQFMGWPMVATGTFAGRVAVVDAVADEAGKYRVLVRPDRQAIADYEREQPWPSPHYLRAGSGATGWMMLNTVPLGYELWRQFNGFPPNLAEAPSAQGASEKAEKGNKPIKRKKAK